MCVWTGAAASPYLSLSANIMPQVAEEVLSVLRLLSPLTDPEWSLSEPSHGQNRLDVALVQLQNVARKLAMSHTSKVNTKPSSLSHAT